MALLQTALVGLRESLEAFLVLGILAGIVRKAAGAAAGASRRAIVGGAVAGALVALATGWIASAGAAAIYQRNAEMFEAVTSLLAVGVLTYMVIWMFRHTQEMMGDLHRRTKAALAVGKPYLLATLGFLVVVREGVETVLFTATRIPVDGALATLAAVLAGVAVSAVLSALVFAGVVRLKIESFMAATGAVLIVVGAGILAYGVHEFSETPAGRPLGNVPEAFDVRGILPHNGHTYDPPINTPAEFAGVFLSGAIGYRANPTWLELGAWASYLGAMMAWYLRGLRDSSGADPAKAA